MLYVVGTPIGNIEDITFRAVDVLKKVDFVLVEDTRRTGKLLKKYGIGNTMITYNDHNKEKKTKKLIEELKEKNAALVSDAGTPGINDPGFYLVRECRRENIEVVPIPGPSAMISALVVSGLPTDKFTFYGFFPKKEGKKLKFVEEFIMRNETAVFYDSPHRIKKTMKLFADHIPEKQVVIAREMTKKFEEFIQGTAKEVYDKIKERNIKGEITVIVSK